MRIVLIFIAVTLLLIESGGMAKPAALEAPAANTSTFTDEKPRIDFDTQVKPIFKSQCMPCHFNGGQMYDRLPFDRAETIRKLGVKVFTRIKGDDDRKLIEAFLAQQP